MTTGSFRRLCVCAACVCAAWGVHASISVVSYDRNARAFQLSLTAADSARDLWLAFGADDGGDAPTDWANLRRVAEVPAGTTQLRCLAPHALDETHHYRFFSLAAGAIPNYTRLAYMTPSSAWFATGLTPCNRTKIDMTIEYPTVPTSRNEAFFAARDSKNSKRDFTLLHMGAASGSVGLRFDYGMRLGGGEQPIASNKVLVVTASHNGLFVDDVKSARDYSSVSNAFAAGGALTFFALNGQFYASFRLYGIRLQLDGQRDTMNLVPVKDGDTVKLYDYVSNTVYAATGGSYVAGPEKGVAADVLDSSASVGIVCSAPYAGTSILEVSHVLVPCTQTLWMVYGPTDGGSDVANWAHIRYLGFLTPEQTDYDYALPADWGVTDKAMRLLRCPTNAVPGYDSLVSVTPSGFGLRMGFTPTSTTAVEMDFVYEKSVPAGSECYYCARDTNATAATSLALMYLKSDTQHTFRYDYAMQNKYVYTYDFTVGTPVSLRTDSAGLYFNGTCVSKTPTKTFTAGSELVLFCLHNGLTTFNFPSKCAYSGVRIWSNEGLAQPDYDLLPVKSAAGKVGFYNRASCTFYDTDAAHLGTGTMKAGAVAVARANAVTKSTPTYTVPTPTLVVTAYSRTAKTAQLTFANVQVPYALYVAYGASDGGDDIADWQHHVDVAEVTPETPILSVTLSAEAVGASYHRFFLLPAGCVIGYDVYDYCQTDNSYVETPINGRNGLTITMEHRYTTIAMQPMFHARVGSSDPSIGFVFSTQQSNALRYDYNVANALVVPNYPAKMLARYYTLCADDSYLFYDGAYIGMCTNATIDAKCPVSLFAYRDSDGKVSVPSNFQFRRARISEGATRLADYVPIATNGVTCLYDRVNDTILAPCFTASWKKNMARGMVRCTATVQARSETWKRKGFALFCK